MTGLMKQYPQYLGIGIDEGTAIVVTGSRRRWSGGARWRSTTRRKPVEPGEPDYEELPSGGVYDLVARRRVETP